MHQKRSRTWVPSGSRIPAGLCCYCMLPLRSDSVQWATVVLHKQCWLELAARTASRDSLEET